VLESLQSYYELLGPWLEASLEAFGRNWADLVPRMRILCVSTVNDSAPMWAHYSDDHKGVVLQLACSDERDSSLLLAQPMMYSLRGPTVPGMDFLAAAILDDRKIDWMEYFKEYYYLNAPGWEYEHEWRVVSFAAVGESGDFGDTGFNPTWRQSISAKTCPTVTRLRFAPSQRHRIHGRLSMTPAWTSVRAASCSTLVK